MTRTHYTKFKAKSVKIASCVIPTAYNVTDSYIIKLS